MKKKFSALVAAMIAICMMFAVLPGCTDDGGSSSSGSGSSTTEKAGLTLDKTTLTLNLGESAQLNASVNSGYTLSWSSSDETVASVLSGLVTANAAGTATVTVAARKKGTTKNVETKTCSVTVENKQIILDKTSVLLLTDVAETAQVTANAEGLSGNIEWSILDDSVATVDSTGLITARKTGTTTAKASVGDVSASVRVTVVKRVFVKANAAADLTTSLSTPVWTTADDKTATVANGKVSGLKAGATIITATQGEQTEQYLVVVYENENSYTLVSGKKADAAQNAGVWNYLLESATATVSEEPTYKNGSLAIDITGVGDSGTNFVYMRYQPDAKGGVFYNVTLNIFAAADGIISINGIDTEVKAGFNALSLTDGYTSKKPGSSDPFQFKFRTATTYIITPVFTESVPEAKLTLDKTSIELLTTEGFNTATITATYEEGSVFTWETSAPEVATVENGVVTAVAPGTATITAKCNGKEASCLVTVSSKSVNLDKTFVQLYLQADADGNLKNTKTLAATSSDNSAITWSSSDETVVTVDNGVITGLKKGWATVTASIAGAKRDCTVYVADTSYSYKMTKANKNDYSADTENTLMGVWKIGSDANSQYNDGTITIVFSKTITSSNPFMIRYQPFHTNFTVTYTIKTEKGGLTVNDGSKKGNQTYTQEELASGKTVTSTLNLTDKYLQIKIWDNVPDETITIYDIVITPIA